MWDTAQSISITSTGAPIAVMVTFSLGYSTSNTTSPTAPQMRLLRDGVVIRGPETFSMITVNNGLFTYNLTSGYIAFNMSDAPAAGAHTYQLQFIYSDSYCMAFQIANSQITLLETKK